MSENEEKLVLADDPSSQFAQILGFLLPAEDETPAGAGTATDDPAGAVAGQQPAAAEGAGAAAGAVVAPAVGDGGVTPVAGEPAAAGAPAVDPAAGDPAAGAVPVPEQPAGVDALEILPKFAEISTAFETRQSELLQNKAFADLQAEHPDYFAALRKHPRQLVGTEVNSLTHQGKEVLRDSADAADWQAGARQLLSDEAESRVEKAKDDLREVFNTVHSSIELFQNNTDLIPGTRQFDKDLANAFAAAAKDYELRSDGKLIGYSVPVQPIINALRSQIATQRAATPPVAAAPTPQQQRVAEQPRTETGQFDAPQAGIRSQAGQSAGGEGDESEMLWAAFARQNGIVL